MVAYHAKWQHGDLSIPAVLSKRRYEEQGAVRSPDVVSLLFLQVWFFKLQNSKVRLWYSQRVIIGYVAARGNKSVLGGSSWWKVEPIRTWDFQWNSLMVHGYNRFLFNFICLLCAFWVYSHASVNIEEHEICNYEYVSEFKTFNIRATLQLEAKNNFGLSLVLGDLVDQVAGSG